MKHFILSQFPKISTFKNFNLLVNNAFWSWKLEKIEKHKNRQKLRSSTKTQVMRNGNKQHKCEFWVWNPATCWQTFAHVSKKGRTLSYDLYIYLSTYLSIHLSKRTHLIGWCTIVQCTLIKVFWFNWDL